MSIPWGAIERRYAALFSNNKGNVAKPLRLGLGACLIQAEYGYSDVESAQMIQQHPYLQYFCGYKSYDDSKPPFDLSLMVYFCRRQALKLCLAAAGIVVVQCSTIVPLASVCLVVCCFLNLIISNTERLSGFTPVDAFFKKEWSY